MGRRGYIETPTMAKDTLFGWAADAGHRWHAVAIGNTLAFFEYAERQRQGIRSAAWKDVLFASHYHPLQAAYYNNLDIFNVLFAWRDLFRVVVFRLDGTVVSNDERKDVLIHR